jgi:flagellar biosynthesis/type III secretory pathway M-ring protein FliF/YscJ
MPARPVPASRAAEPAKSETAPQGQAAAGAFNPITGPTSGQTIVEPDLNAVRRIAANDPAATAQVIKEWLAHAGRAKQSS